MARPVAPRGQGRERVLAAALDLFAEHGTSGTSLQMIADRMGVTKAAVYFQFHAKDDIVLAVLQPVFDRLEGLVEAAEAVEGRAEQVDAVVTGLVDVVVDHRRLVALLRGDPSVGRHLEEHEPMPSVVARLGALMLGPDPSPSARVAASVAGAGLMLATADPQLADLDDEVLRRELLRCSRLLLRA
ncbi:TetR/AcrR family transcriptional regulator [Angustibacter aerolatus]